MGDPSQTDATSDRGLPAAHRLALTEPSRRRTNAAPYTPAPARPLIRTIRDSGWRGG